MLCLCVERLRVAGVSSEQLPGKWITLFFFFFILANADLVRLYLKQKDHLHPYTSRKGENTAVLGGCI